MCWCTGERRQFCVCSQCKKTLALRQHWCMLLSLTARAHKHTPRAQHGPLQVFAGNIILTPRVEIDRLKTRFHHSPRKRLRGPKATRRRNMLIHSHRTSLFTGCAVFPPTVKPISLLTLQQRRHSRDRERDTVLISSTAEYLADWHPRSWQIDGLIVDWCLEKESAYFVLFCLFFFFCMCLFLWCV